MPEGDSLHRIAARLQVLVGERIEAETPHPRAALTGVGPAVDGRVLEGVEAVGKNLLLRFEGGVTVRSHLRMSGRWRVDPRGTRRTGRPWLVLRGTEWEAVQWNGPVLSLDDLPVAGLGPDVLDGTVDPDVLVRRLRREPASRLLGESLLDQRVVAGIGNMWMAEMLWRARVSPWLPVGEATDDELTAALTWGSRMMRAAVAGPRPLRSVYRRTRRPCPRCAAPVRSSGLGDDNRTAYWCPRCQRGPEWDGAPDGTSSLDGTT
ncbi:MAG TPA: DNA-formamidopyrimidine glycosylase family protein [Gaiella sp.]|jgi:endonuclease-8